MVALEPGAMRLAAEMCLWWAASTAAYLLLVTSPTGIEVPVGLAVGAACALVGAAGRRAFKPPGRVPAFVRRALLLPVDVAGDAVTLTRLLVTGEAFTADVGKTDEVVLPDDDGVRAWAVLLVSAAPGSLAAEVEERDGSLVLHRHRITSHHRAGDRWEVG
jgi:multisubunit Na+/H+ antiporter MnhE subunit